MGWERGFSFWMDEKATPAEITKFALNLRFVYTRIYLKRYGTPSQCEEHESNLNSLIEDNLGLRCVFPNLREDVTAKQRKLVLFQPKGHSDEVVKDFQNCLKELFG